MGENRNECGIGLSIALTREHKETGTSYGLEMMAERTATRENIGLQLKLQTTPVWWRTFRNQFCWPKRPDVYRRKLPPGVLKLQDLASVQMAG